METRWRVAPMIVTLLLVGALPGFSALEGSEAGKEQTQVIPVDLDIRKEVLSQGGAYKVAYKIVGDAVPSDKLHDWLLTLTDAAGNPVEGVHVEITSFMPAHQHGAKTLPQMTQHLRQDKHLVEGMYFNMKGWWVTRITIKRGDLVDNADFNVVIK